MCAQKKQDEEPESLPKETGTERTVIRTTLNGHIYRSLDGINWELEKDSSVSTIAGTPTNSSPAKKPV